MVSLELFIDIMLPTHCSVALGLIQPLTEMSTRNISWGGKGGRRVGLTTLPPSCADCLETWEPQPSETLRACSGLYWVLYLHVMVFRKVLDKPSRPA